jgi:hypothetical protein
MALAGLASRLALLASKRALEAGPDNGALYNGMNFIVVGLGLERSGSPFGISLPFAGFQLIVHVPDAFLPAPICGVHESQSRGVRRQGFNSFELCLNHQTAQPPSWGFSHRDEH